MARLPLGSFAAGHEDTKMAKKNITAQSEPFFMTGTECAAFIEKNRKKIRLRGKREDIDDAISEIICKCLQVENGFGTLLQWDDDPFATARTEEEWLSFLAWQCRARLGVIQHRNGYWYDPDIIQEYKTEDELDGLHAGDSAAREDAEDDNEEEVDPDEEKLRRQRRIIAYLIAEEERRASNHQPVPGKSYDDEIKYEAAYAVLSDLVKYHLVSTRDLEIWMAKVLDCRGRYEISEKFGVTPNNLDQIVYRVYGKLSKFGPALHRKHTRRLFHAAA